MTEQANVTFFDQGDGNLQSRSVSSFSGSRSEDPAGYVASPDLVDAINAAILLGQPLLLTGEPGVGKTSIGRTVADRLGLPLLEFTVKSTSRAVDLFYEYDAVGRFQSAEADRASAARLAALTALDPGALTQEIRSSLSHQATIDPRLELLRYIKVRALGRAILNASSASDVSLLLSDNEHAPSGRRYHRPPDGGAGRWDDHIWPAEPTQSVVIIDEIDKAPSDFCNDLLDELEMMRFQVPELAIYSNTGDAPRFGGNLDTGKRPIVFITSNQERPLPDAFLRRCCYHHISMPEREALDSIIRARLGGLSALDPGTQSEALGIYSDVSALALTRRPGLAELLNWLRYIAFHKDQSGHSLRDKAFLVRSMTALVKDPLDQDKVRTLISNRVG